MKPRINFLLCLLAWIFSFLFSVNLVLAANNLPTDNKQAALQELSQTLGKDLKTPADAHAACSLSENLNTCAEIGKKYKLYSSADESRVNVILVAVKSAGVDIAKCQGLDADTASIDLLRACTKLAQQLGKFSLQPQVNSQENISGDQNENAIDKNKQNALVKILPSNSSTNLLLKGKQVVRLILSFGQAIR